MANGDEYLNQGRMVNLAEVDRALTRITRILPLRDRIGIWYNNFMEKYFRRREKTLAERGDMEVTAKIMYPGFWKGD